MWLDKKFFMEVLFGMKETAMYSNGGIKSLVERLQKTGYPNSAILEFVGKEHPEKSGIINQLKDSDYSDEAILELLVSKPEETSVKKTVNGKEVISEQELTIRVSGIMQEIGMPAHIKGYQYVRTAITMTTKNPSMLDSVTKVLYPTVAKQYGSTSSRVERAIRHAIETAWDRGDPNVLASYFKYTIQSGKGKPTNSEFIAMISDKLRLKYVIE